MIRVCHKSMSGLALCAGLLGACHATGAGSAPARKAGSADGLRPNSVAALGSRPGPIAGRSSAHARRFPLPLRLVRDVPLPGRPTRFDYESYDPRSGLLFISHLGDSQVLAFNTRTQKLQGIVRGVSQVHGVLAVPSLGRVYASATGVDQIDSIDERTLKVTARVPGGNYPDGMAYDPRLHLLFVSDESGGTDTVIDTRTQRRVATIPLGGHAGNTQYDPATGRMFVDVQTEDRLKAIDPRTDRIIASYPLPGCQHDHGLNIDAPRRLAFVACDGNARLLTFSLAQHRVLAIHKLGRYPDVLSFDAKLRRLYVASESGVVTVFALRQKALHLLGRAYLAYEAHSVAVDSWHRVYFPLQDVGGRPLLRVMRPVIAP